MKILKKDLKNGVLRLRIEVPDDLYYLADVISAGDLVSSKTKRRIELDRDTHRAERIDKRTMTLELTVQDVEFDRTVDRLRISGKIIKGPEEVAEGDFHTLNLKPGMVLKIQKESWNNSDLIKLEDAVKTIKVKILLVAIDEGFCSLGMLRNYGVQKIGDISASISGKREIEAKKAETNKFFQDVFSAVECQENIDRIILAGPGFIKDSFYNFIKEKNPELSIKIVVEDVSMSGDRGLQEIVKRGILEKIIKESKINFEIQNLNKFFEEISKDSGLAVYGLQETVNACNMGAIETLMISNDFLRTAKVDKNEEVETLISSAKQMKGNIVIVSEEHDLGKQLSGLGGVAALLRYKI